MKNFFLGLILSTILIPSFAFAAPNIGIDATNNIATGAGYDPADTLSLSQTVGRYIKVALSLIGTIFVVLTVYAGFLWMTASGNEESVTKAKDIIKMATIGLAITLSAFSITAFVVANIGSSATAPKTTTGGGAPSCSTGGFTTEFSCWWSGVTDQWNAHPWGQTN